MLKKASGSKSKTLSHFKAQLKQALDDLATIGFIRPDFYIDASNTVHVKRIQAKSGFLKYDRF